MPRQPFTPCVDSLCSAIRHNSTRTYGDWTKSDSASASAAAVNLHLGGTHRCIFARQGARSDDDPQCFLR